MTKPIVSTPMFSPQKSFFFYIKRSIIELRPHEIFAENRFYKRIQFSPTPIRSRLAGRGLCASVSRSTGRRLNEPIVTGFWTTRFRLSTIRRQKPLPLYMRETKNPLPYTCTKDAARKRKRFANKTRRSSKIWTRYLLRTETCLFCKRDHNVERLFDTTSFARFPPRSGSSFERWTRTPSSRTSRLRLENINVRYGHGAPSGCFGYLT